MLRDVIVVDLTRALAGPYATMMLADMGARVIKVESPDTGDESRSWGPPFVSSSDGHHRESTYFLSCNRNKESVTADLKTTAGKNFLSSLVKRADVLIENFRPGTLERLGFGIDALHELNNRLVIASVTGFGHDGPERDRPGYDQIAQGEAGIMNLTGTTEGDPLKVGLPIGDLLAGMNIAFAITSALYERQSLGRGRIVRTSLLSSLVSAHAFQGTRWTVAGDLPRRTGNHHPSIAPYGLFHTADGPIQIAVGNEGTWRRFATALSIDSDPRFATNQARVLNRHALTDMVEQRLRTAGSKEWLDRLSEAGVPVGQVRDLEQVYSWDQVESQGLLLSVSDTAFGDLTLPGPAIRVDDNRFAGTRHAHLPPPRLGEHNKSIRRWLQAQPAPRP